MDTNAKMWDRNYWYCRFRTKLLKFLQGALEIGLGSILSVTMYSNGIQSAAAAWRSVWVYPYKALSGVPVQWNLLLAQAPCLHRAVRMFMVNVEKFLLWTFLMSRQECNDIYLKYILVSLNYRKNATNIVLFRPLSFISNMFILKYTLFVLVSLHWQHLIIIVLFSPHFYYMV